MTGILRDLGAQVAQALILAAFAMLVLSALCLFELVRVGLEGRRARGNEKRAGRRLERQSALGLRQRITGDEIAKRNR